MTISAADILAVTRPVLSEWTKQRKAEERGRSRATREYIYSDRVDFTEVADSILPAAYEHASGGGKYSVSQRQLYYASREAFREQTDREIEYAYFSQTILRKYLNSHPSETATWKVTADARGTLTIPNSGHDKRVPVGTLQIDEHLRNASLDVEPLDVDATLDTEWPSLAAGQRYQAVLYIEKEGFEPLLKEAEIAERFDLAILSCKGQSVVAARHFIDETCYVGGGVPLFVVHDLDKYGFEISQRLTTVSESQEEKDCVAYQFQNEIDVTDLGLRLTDVKKYGLVSEQCGFKGRFAFDSIATAEEKEFLRSGKRVELNAFTSPQFIEWLESKLSKYLPKRLIPSDDVLESAYRRALAIAKINTAIEEARDDAVAKYENAPIPKSLRRKLQAEMKSGKLAWDAALYDLAKETIDEEGDD